MFRQKKDRKLGVAEGKRRYDLPLNKSEGTDFLILLVILMTFLATAALSGSFALSAMGERWSSGLENKATIEIPAETASEKLRTYEKIRELTEKAEKTLQTHKAIKSAKMLDEQDIQKLISPWLGDGAALEDIPLPGLIGVEFKKDMDPEEDLADIKAKLQKIAPDIRIDRHESWLGDILRFTGALQFAAAMIVIIISITTVIAIAGAIRSRIAVHKADVELLHLMGASDEYITRQFQRHAFILTLRGSIIGVGTGALFITLLGLLSARAESVLIPHFELTTIQTGILAALPLITCIIGTLTARFTVLRSLSQMP